MGSVHFVVATVVKEKLIPFVNKAKDDSAIITDRKCQETFEPTR